MSGNFADSLPQELVTHVTEMCGSKGEEWFTLLPALIDDCEKQWDIRVGRPFPGIEYNFVAEAVSEKGIPMVVKIAPPFETAEIQSEAKFLKVLDGRGAVKLIAEDRKRKAIFIERALPGKGLT